MFLLRLCLAVIGIAIGTMVFMYFMDVKEDPSLRTGDVPEILRLAAEGHADGEYRLGLLHMQGIEGMSQDPVLARQLYESAALKGHAGAQFVLANMYERGIGIPRDLKTAAYWYRLSALGGNATAQYQMGRMYEEDQGLSRDLRLAIIWYQKAARQGHQEASERLSRIKTDLNEPPH